MDFILSLTHFCEVHGPKSVLCTQVLPLECALCLPPSPPLRPTHSSDSLATQVHEDTISNQSSQAPSLRKTETNLTLPTDFSGASTTIDSSPSSPTLERHPLFRNIDQKNDFAPQFRYGRAQGETCASCSFTVPKEIAAKLPAGAPGSVHPDGMGKNGAPVLRSREFVCLGRGGQDEDKAAHPEPSSSHESKTSSFKSRSSAHTDCHDHRLTYLTAKSPEDPESYSTLRSSVIRTLSCEVLPRGMSDGPLCFGDSIGGYTIAWVFRLTDPKARGRRRTYAFVALAGKDTSRAFRACPMIWKAFADVAWGIEEAAQRYQDQQKREEEANRGGSSSRDYTPVSSFLTQRITDPDGHPRGTRQVPPRSLAEIVGNEHIFTYLHQYFIAILRDLGDRFGGLPLADTPSVYQTMADETVFKEGKLPSRLHAEMVDELVKARDNDTTPTPQLRDEIEAAKARMNRSIKRNSQCAPLVVNTTASRQVVV